MIPVLSYLSPPRKIRVRVRVRVRAIRAVRVAIALRIPLKTIDRVYTHFTARSHNRRYCYDSPNNFWGVINRKVPMIPCSNFMLLINLITHTVTRSKRWYLLYRLMSIESAIDSSKELVTRLVFVLNFTSIYSTNIFLSNCKYLGPCHLVRFLIPTDGVIYCLVIKCAWFIAVGQ